MRQTLPHKADKFTLAHTEVGAKHSIKPATITSGIFTAMWMEMNDMKASIC